MIRVEQKKLHWHIFQDGKEIGCFWHACGQFWWCLHPSIDGDIMGKNFSSDITETSQMVEFVVEQYNKKFAETKPC